MKIYLVWLKLSKLKVSLELKFVHKFLVVLNLPSIATYTGTSISCSCGTCGGKTVLTILLTRLPRKGSKVKCRETQSRQLNALLYEWTNQWAKGKAQEKGMW